MSDGSSIEWTDATWTVAVGCTRVSAGCDNCYAATFVHRGLHESHKGLTVLRPKSAKRPGVDWNGKVRIVPKNLSLPLKWRTPRRIFVGSMTDIFHHRTSMKYIAALFGVMAMASHHTYQILTKRPDRMLEFFAWLDEQSKAFRADARALANANGNRVKPDPRVLYCIDIAEREGIVSPDLASATRAYSEWPLRCVHIGASVEDQATADERIPLLLKVPAVIRWVSCEPMLGPVAFDTICSSTTGHGQALQTYANALSWVVVGGESGAKARAFDVGWARDVIAAGRLGGMRVYVKQLGSHPRSSSAGDKRHCGDTMLPSPFRMFLEDCKGGDEQEWPDDLRVREAPPDDSLAWLAAMRTRRTTTRGRPRR